MPNKSRKRRQIKMAEYKKCLCRFWSGIRQNISLIITISSLFVSIITLFVAVNAYKIADSSLSSANQSLAIAEQSLILTSKDFTPVLEIDINDESGDFFIKNVLPLLFTIESIDAYKIIERGVELQGEGSIRSFSLLTRAAHYEVRHFDFFDKVEHDSNEIYLNINKSMMLVASVRIYNDNEIDQIDNYLN